MRGKAYRRRQIPAQELIQAGINIDQAFKDLRSLGIAATAADVRAYLRREAKRGQMARRDLTRKVAL